MNSSCITIIVELYSYNDIFVPPKIPLKYLHVSDGKISILGSKPISEVLPITVEFLKVRTDSPGQGKDGYQENLLANCVHLPCSLACEVLRYVFWCHCGGFGSW